MKPISINARLMAIYGPAARNERGGAVLYRTTSVFDRVFGLEHGVDRSPIQRT